MEAIRKRFRGPTPLTRPTPAPEPIANSPSSDNDSHPPPSTASPSLRIDLSPTRAITLAHDKVTLHDTHLGQSVICIASSAQLKVTALQDIHDHLQLQSRTDLDPINEAPIVHKILQKFISKVDCLIAITQFSSDTASVQILSLWAEDLWSFASDNNSDGESRDGSLFSDSDVQEIPSTTRVRPITLRPRRPPAPTPSVFIKQEKIIKSEKRTYSPTEKPAAIQNPTHRVRRGSPIRVTEKGSRTGLGKGRTLSSPTLRHKPTNLSLRQDFHPSNGGATVTFHKAAKKRVLPHSHIENTPAEEDNRKTKRIKSADTLGSPSESHIHRENPDATTVPSDKPEISDFIRVLKSPGKNFIDEFWKTTVASFPESVRQRSKMEEKVEWFFKDVEFLRRENEIIKRDEKERRKGMLLMGEKIKLLNQPVKRGIDKE